jgi:hypothetical protein
MKWGGEQRKLQLTGLKLTSDRHRQPFEKLRDFRKENLKKAEHFGSDIDIGDEKQKKRKLFPASLFEKDMQKTDD